MTIMRRIGRSVALTFALLAAVLGSQPAGAEARAVEAEITFVTSKSLYVSAGSDHGVAVGDPVTVVRDGVVIARAEVSDLSGRKSVCTILERSADPRVGDTVHVEASAPPGGSEPETAATSVQSGTRQGASRSRRGVHGRIGARFLSVADRTDTGSDYTQPAFEFRIDGNELGDSAWGFAADVRARRTFRNLSDGGSSDDSRTRVYRLAVHRKAADDPWTLTLGRQFSPELSAVSIFDGISARYGSKRWAAGLFSGTQPDAEDYGYASDLREHGGFVQFFDAGETRKHWQLTTGLIGSYEDSELNREFLYLQGRFSSPRLYGYLTQEVDYNRGWKADQGESTLSSSSTFLTLRVQANRALAFNAGYDNRRNVRLYRDLVTPATEFDDSYRRGLWVGSSILIRQRYRVSLDAKTSQRDATDDADSYTAAFAVYRLTRYRIDLRARSSRYTNDYVEGWLHALDAGADLGRAAHLSLQGGRRSEDNLLTLPATSTIDWYGVDLDLTLGRSWYAILSVERTSSELEESDLFFSSLLYRF